MQHNFSGIIVDANGKKKRPFAAGDVMADGEYLAVPTPSFTMVFNHKGETVRLGDAALKAINIPTFDAAQHRPGHRNADTVTLERAAGARAVHMQALGDAWRSPALTADTAARTADARADYKASLSAAWRHAQ